MKIGTLDRITSLSCLIVALVIHLCIIPPTHDLDTGRTCLGTICVLSGEYIFLDAPFSSLLRRVVDDCFWQMESDFLVVGSSNTKYCPKFPMFCCMPFLKRWVADSLGRVQSLDLERRVCPLVVHDNSEQGRVDDWG